MHGLPNLKINIAVVSTKKNGIYGVKTIIPRIITSRKYF